MLRAARSVPRVTAPLHGRIFMLQACTRRTTRCRSGNCRVSVGQTCRRCRGWCVLTYPFPLTRSHLPFPLTRSRLPVHACPFPLTRSRLPVPAYPFPLTCSHLNPSTGLRPAVHHAVVEQAAAVGQVHGCVATRAVACNRPPTSLVAFCGAAHCTARDRWDATLHVAFGAARSEACCML